MVEINWKSFLALKPEALSEQEKDDLYDTVTWYVPDFNLEKKCLVHFVRISQEILKFKAEQVESLTNELDEIAARQGKEEGSKINQYIEEIEQLREELEYHKKLDRSSSRSTYVSNDDLRREMVKLEIQNEDLISELKEKEIELVNEKEETEKYAGKVASLEREKQELIRELKALQEETVEKSARSVKDSPESGIDKCEELTEMIRQKNKHISQLLEDIELVEEENYSLRSKLTSVRDELAETTTHITEITAELAKLKFLNEEFQNKNSYSENKIKALTTQIEELLEEKKKHDEQLDEYIMMSNNKLEEWKKVLDSKDEEILKLREEIKNLNSSPSGFPSSDDRKLQTRITEQEKQINILQQELQRATEEINSSVDLIEKLKEKQLKLISAPQHAKSTFVFYEERIKVLEEKLMYAEEDAIAKAEEMSELVIQLREYESGVFGLSEAISKIKKLEKSVQEKNLQIEKLVEICNHLEIKLDNFEEQNLSLRERLGLSACDEIDTSGVKLKYKKDEELLQNLKIQLDRKEEELVKIKLKYRKVVKFLKTYPVQAIGETKESAVEVKDSEELKQKLEAIITENDALRKGMHEILDSIRKQDCVSSVEVQSACLERLLEALDSRHVSGWYHPAMRLQAQLSTEEGKNEELRSQIRSLKTEEKKRVSELQNAYLKIQSLENDLSTPRYEEERKVQSKTPDTEEDETSRKQSVFSTQQEGRIIELESQIRELKLSLDRKKVDEEKLERSFLMEKENLLTKITELECQLREFENQNPDLARIPKLSSQLAVLERKVDFLKSMETAYRESNEKLKEEMIEEEEKMLQDALKLHNEKSKLLAKIEELEEVALNSVPKQKLDGLNKELFEMKAKYQQAINQLLMKEDECGSEELQTELALLRDEKQAVLDELRVVKEKLIAAEALISEEVVTKGDFSHEISILASKLAACEVRETNETQKSSHLEKLNDMLKLQQREIETRNKELIEQVAKLTEDVERYRETERNLRMKVLAHVSEEDMSVLEEKIKTMQIKCKELTTERDNVQELFEISQGQCRALQEKKQADKILITSLNEQVLVLQSLDEDKAAVSRLSHELAMAKIQGSQLSKKNNDLKMKVTKLLAQNVSLEMKITESSRDFFLIKKKHLNLIEYLYEAMDEVRGLYAAPVRFRDVESISKIKTELNKQKKDQLEKIKELKLQTHEYSLKKEEMETQLESLENLKLAFSGDSKNLIHWHNKSAELRLKEAKCRRENEFLVGEISQLENILKKLNEEITKLEEESIAKDKEWERKQVLWEQAQLQMCQLLKEKGVTRKVEKCCDATTNTEPSQVFSKTEDKVYETKVQSLEADIAKLRKESEEKDAIIVMKEKILNGKSKTIELEETFQKEKSEDTEKEALKVTVQSLQNIIQQKEETILRYQDLLKEGREEYSRACTKLQDELRSLNETMAAQSKAYSKLKNAVHANNLASENIPAVVEKYITKIHELEEELGECQMNLSNTTAKVISNQQELEKWKGLAEERLSMIEEIKQRVEKECRNEIENYKEEIKRYQRENERLSQSLELLRSDGAKGDGTEGKLMQTIQQLQAKLLDQERDQVLVKSDQLSDCTFDKPQRQRSGQTTREVETLKRQLKFSRDESTRLREQIRLLQSRTQKRPKTAGSSTTRSDSKSSVKEESLTSKIKHLEELLTVSKERERELMEINQKKLKTTEEVARWDERKKSQQTIQNLTSKIKEKEAEVEVLKNKNESFRNMVYKCERDKSILESQLKMAKGGTGSVSAKIEKLTLEKNELEEEVFVLKNQLEEQMRHSGGLGAALLQSKLEEQERKLAAFELASKGQNALIDELEKLKLANSNLEKLNLKLESENLSLQLKLEKEKAEAKFLLDKMKQRLETTDEVKRQESDRTLSQLHKKIEKLTEENKRLRCEFKEPRSYGTVERVRLEIAKLREEHEVLRGKYMEAIDKNITLEKEVKNYQYQIHLMEEKDLAEVLTRKNKLESTSELSRELMEVKAKLAHKTHLLGRVKTLLVKAAAKEKALIQKVCFLQSMVPNPTVHVHG